MDVLIAMKFANYNDAFPGSIPGTRQSPYRALGWSSSFCVHAMAVAMAVVVVRDLPPVPTPAYRMELLLVDPQDRANPVTPQETSTLAEDSLPLAPSPPQPTQAASAAAVERPPLVKSAPVQQTAQSVAATAAVPQATDVSSTADDYVAAHPEPIDRAEVLPTLESAASPSPEPITENFHDDGKPPSPPLPEPLQHPVDDSAAPTSTTLTQSAAREDSASLPPTDPGPVSDSQQAPTGSSSAPATEIPAMSHPPIERAGPTKADYAWLMELLRRRIISLQAYPHLARAQGWEGVVVVKTTINSDGDLVDAVVTKSSGYSALDEDAVKLMHRVCPVHLTHDLGKSKIAVMVPIRYRLDGFER